MDPGSWPEPFERVQHLENERDKTRYRGLDLHYGRCKLSRVHGPQTRDRVGESFIEPKIIIKLGNLHGWTAHASRSSGSHTVMLRKPDGRTVPVRNKIKGRLEAQRLLKELEVPREDWPEKVR